MKTDEARDDEILGRALSRAIETLEVTETPYERSRLALRPLTRGTSYWRVAALAASIVLAGAFGAMLLESAKTPAAPVAQQPTATVAATPTPAATVTPTVTPTAVPNAVDHQRLFFYRDGLPPTSQHLSGVGTQATAEERIRARLDALNNARSGVSPEGGAGNAFPLQDPRLLHVASVKIQGETATVDFTLPAGSWATTGATRSLALRQQLVYTATEEPGIRRLLVTENGGKPTTIDQIVWGQPLSREDVSGYAAVRDGETVGDTIERRCGQDACPQTAVELTNTYSVDSFAQGVARFVVQIESGRSADFSATVRKSDDTKTPWSGKYMLELKVAGAERRPGLEIVDRSPIRSISSSAPTQTGVGTTTYELALDDLRPWRVAILTNPDRVVVDFGGYARSISPTVAVYNPAPIAARSGASLAADPSIGRQFTVSGLSRTFEATTAWRVVDSGQRVVASGHTTASRGTSAIWGTYQLAVQLPATVSGNVTLEVFWPSPRDGSDVDLVQVPLVVR